jgi:CheY-like chemotaxis protein
MNQDIKILYLEDDPADAVRVEDKLRESGLCFELQRADTQDAFLAGLELRPDVILSDHGLPTFDGLTAFGTAREKCPDTPFIFVTNALTREMEIEKLLGGIADYVRKDELDYLAVAMRHALREAKESRARRQRVREFFESPLGKGKELLPICSSCKKIRNKQNHWQPLEIFFLENFNIGFTHGICPQCTPNFFSRK